MREYATTVKLNIGGMSCIHCQEKIEGELNRAQGVISATVSYGSGTAEIVYDGQIISKDGIIKIIEGLDYKVIPDGAYSAKTLLYPFIIFAIITAAFVLLQTFGVLNYLAPSSIDGDYGAMGYGMLFVIGLVTSVHCIAMCGGINLSQCIPKSENSVSKGLGTFLPALTYNLGRVVSYTLAGFILGLAGWAIGGGATVGIPYIVQGILKIIAGILMIVMGVNMLGIVPALRKLNPRLPRFLTKRIGKKKHASASPFIVGILNGIMPCGPLQSMWIVALATGNPFSGALSMFLFAMGTVPLMLGLGSVVAKLGQKFTKAVMCVGSLLVVVLGLAMLSQGGSLTGIDALSPVVISAIVLALIFAGVICSVPLHNKGLKICMRIAACCLVIVVGMFSYWYDNRIYLDDSFKVATMNDDGTLQTVEVTIDWSGYPRIAVAKGVPVEFTLTVPEGYLIECNRWVVIEDFEITFSGETVTSPYGEKSFELTEGDNLFEFTPAKTGTYRYRCWMGMLYGYITVTS